MASLFSASELINIAIREEVTGGTYYRAIAERAVTDDLKEFALETADMEDAHAEKFRRLLAEAEDAARGHELLGVGRGGHGEVVHGHLHHRLGRVAAAFEDEHGGEQEDGQDEDEAVDDEAAHQSVVRQPTVG